MINRKKFNTPEFNNYSRFQSVLYMLCSMSVLFWPFIHMASAQMHESAFGEVYTVTLPEKFERSILVSSDRQGLITLAVWSENRTEILLVSFDSTRGSADFQLKHLPYGIDDLYAADINEDGTADLVLVNTQDKTIALVLDLSQDSLKVINPIKLPFEPGRIFIGDYNNDKHLDVLVTTHKITGILPLKGDGKGRFSPGKTIASENAVGALDFAYVNNDNLIDIIMWDWINNELHMLYGVGKGRFIDQSVFPVEGDVENLVAASIIREHSVDLILKMSKPYEFQVWEGNDFGDFQLKYHIPFEGRVTDFSIADVNNDGLNDVIVTLNPASMQVVFNNDENAFSDRIEYSSGEDPKNVIIPAYYRGNLPDCIVFDRTGGQIIVYRNALRSLAMEDSAQIATGLFPTEIVTNDFNRDGFSDIALVNTKSKSVSLYFGRRGAVPLGPFSYSLIDEPRHLAFHSSTDTALRLVFSFPGTQQISYFTLYAANDSIFIALMGSEGDAQVLNASLNYHRKAEFVTLNTLESEGSSLSFYEQLDSNTFIERTFRLLPPDYLLGASVADLNNDGFYDIVYVYQPGDTSTVELGVAFGDSSYSMKQRVISRELTFPGVQQVFIYLFDFDKDSVLDLLIHSGPPAENLKIYKGLGNGQFRAPNIFASDIPMSERSDIQFIDIDGDGLFDIVIGSQKLGKVLWWRNLGDLNFSSSNVLVSEQGMNHYVISDIDADGTNDIVMTLWNRGVLKIINGRRLPFHTEMNSQ